MKSCMNNNLWILEARHTTEMEREPYQRSCVLAGKKLGVFMAECGDIHHKLLVSLFRENYCIKKLSLKLEQYEDVLHCRI